MGKTFDTNSQDSQGTFVLPVLPEHFDFEHYQAYESSLQERNRSFTNSTHGLLVYRRVRANGVFYDKCRDKKDSLALQLGALMASLDYEADIANFLEPWYGIGYIASCFGSDYIWHDKQAPAVLPKFKTVQEILSSDYIPIHQTPVGKHILEMIEYFMDKTKGRVPISFSDVQSPLNMLSYLLPVNDLFLEIYDDPDAVSSAAELTATLLIEFLNHQKNLIGSSLASPGHGFASSRAFRGVGMSDDNAIMLQPDDYLDLFRASDERIGAAFNGTVFHSCGNWENKISMVRQLKGLTAVDGAFSQETDPSPNDPAVFGAAFMNSGVIINARAVGNANDSYSAFLSLYRKNQRLIAVTYCKTPEEQAKLYRLLHSMD